ncbi:putative outer membrane starch-binding protein [Nonlabens dokdonensis]|uniref:Outer membrane starch-binding protein n=2 Tax=Nonlabens dokdonensis TaxID=328515 RepID=A0ABX5Q2Z2_9FLAO|nr:RagB/SusD family nutrient uptake outer membrane protein [Nonlabens dokdonensis]AGC76660.1 putative outer membrane protein, probably involved in nutrient binding protein [Nonlabens dokdonensis DSW-6]PZX44309.1 putative outer membrane starch-binding protein [Nonlabens dokdonensis]
MKIFKVYILLFVFVVAFNACSEDYIEVVSEDPNSENFFNSQEDYESALVGAYDLLQSSYLNVMLGEIASDNTLAGGESATDVIGIQQIDDMIHTPVNEQLSDIWRWMFAGVNRANFIMEFQDKTDFPDKPRVLGETRFLRAYYYFELVKFFGDVPLVVDQRFLFGDQFEVDRTPKADVYAQIERDLIFAIDNLQYTTPDVGRATKGSAQALLGKVYLFQEKYQEAADVLDDLILSNEYSLVTDYSTIFENDNENNSESVFEVQYSDLEGAGFGCLQCSEGNVAVGFNGIRNYDGPEFDSGFSFNVPTQEVFDLFDAADPRRDVAILDIDTFAASNGATFSTGFEHTGFYNRKYIARQGDLNTGDANLTNPNNYRAIRLADVYLMAAEAYNSGNLGDGQARTYLNTVRTRANLPDVQLSGVALADAIFLERRLELVGEGHHFFDLVRTGRAATEINGFVTGKHEVFPIPLEEILLAGNRWEQNPNY